MKLDSLNDLKDEELQAVIARSNELLMERDRQRKDEAVEQARAILAVAGLNLRDVAAGKAPRGANGKGQVYHGGRTYQHPADKTKVWTAKGQKPGWLRDLEATGRRAVEIAPEAVNDNVPPSIRKTG